MKNDPLLGSLCSVLGAPLLAVLHALGVEYAAQDVIAHARKVLHAAATDHDHRVLLQIVALARDVADHLETVGQTHLRDLAQRRVRLLRRRRVHARAHAALLRRLLQRRHGVSRPDLHPRLADQLVDGRHRFAFVLLVQWPTRGLGSLQRAKRKSAIRSQCGRALFRSQKIAGASAARSSLTRLTVGMSEAAFELHPSRRWTVPRPKETRYLNDLAGSDVPFRRGRSSPPAEKCGTCIGGGVLSQGRESEKDAIPQQHPGLPGNRCQTVDGGHPDRPESAQMLMAGAPHPRSRIPAIALIWLRA